MRCSIAIVLLLCALSASASSPRSFFMAKMGGAAPTTPVITATGGGTTVTVALASGDAGALTNVLYWDTVTRADYSLYSNSISNVTLVAAGFPGTPYVHTGRTNGTTYYYRLRGTDITGSTQSAEVSAADVPDYFSAGLEGWTVTANNTRPSTGGANGTNYYLSVSGSETIDDGEGGFYDPAPPVISKNPAKASGTLSFWAKHNFGTDGTFEVSGTSDVVLVDGVDPGADNMFVPSAPDTNWHHYTSTYSGSPTELAVRVFGPVNNAGYVTVVGFDEVTY